MQRTRTVLMLAALTTAAIHIYLCYAEWDTDEVEDGLIYLLPLVAALLASLLVCASCELLRRYLRWPALAGSLRMAASGALLAGVSIPYGIIGLYQITGSPDLRLQNESVKIYTFMFLCFVGYPLGAFFATRLAVQLKQAAKS